MKLKCVVHLPDYLIIVDHKLLNINLYLYLKTGCSRDDVVLSSEYIVNLNLNKPCNLVIPLN